jgi:hypothetical protein
MSLEAILERIALSLETIAAASGAPATPAEPVKAKKTAAKPAPEAAAPAPAPEPAAAPAPKAPTLEDAQQLVGAFLKANQRELVKGLLGRYNAAKASEIKDLPAFIAEATELLATVG